MLFPSVNFLTLFYVCLFGFSNCTYLICISYSSTLFQKGKRELVEQMTNVVFHQSYMTQQHFAN